MGARLIASFIISICGLAEAADLEILFSGERKLNNLVSELLAVSSISKLSRPFTFTRSTDGWIFISATCKGMGTVRVILDQETGGDAVIIHDGAGRSEAVRYITKGTHTVQVEPNGKIAVANLVAKGIPELIHCGLGFNPEIKS